MGDGGVRSVELSSVRDPKQRWRLDFDAEGASLEPVGEPGRRIRVYRPDFASTFELVRGLGLRVLVVRHPVRKLQLKLEPAQVASIEAQLGASGPAFLRSALRRRYALALPLGAVMLLLSFDGAGENGVRLDPLQVALGAGIVGLWAWSRLRPHPAVLLADAVWFALAGSSSILSFVRRGSWLGILFGVFAFSFAWQGISEFRRYRRGDRSPFVEFIGRLKNTTMWHFFS